MKHVSILLLEQVNLAGLENARQGFQEANQFSEEEGNGQIFDIKIVGTQKSIQVNNGLYTAHCDALISDIETTDVIVIPPVQPKLEVAIARNSSFFKWIKSQHQKGAEIVSLCLGAFILAGTGLLHGRDCVTHWQAQDAFSQHFPAVNLLSDKLLTDQDGLYTGGGAFSSANLILYFIEKVAGRECAVYCSKVFQIDMGRQSQSPFSIFKGQYKHSDRDILEIQHYFERNFSQKISIDHLCKKFGIARRTLERRFKKATANTPLEYLQRVRIEAAKKMLEEGRKTVNETVYAVGYNDIKTFRELFKKLTGITPNEYKLKFSFPNYQ